LCGFRDDVGPSPKMVPGPALQRRTGIGHRL